jgi:hypothetical protein
MANNRKNTTTAMGNRVGSTRYLLASVKDGYTIKAGPGDGHPVRHEPRTKYDPQPFTDGTFWYGSIDCWAAPPTASE